MKILKFIISNLNELHTGTIIQKGFATVKLSAVPAVGFSLLGGLTGWYIENQIFLSFVFIAICIDHLLGSYVHWQIKEDFSPKKNLSGLLQKGFSVVAGYVLFEMIHQIVDDVEFIAIYFKVLLQLIVFLYPAGSAMANLSIITKGKFPPIGWMKKLDSFNNNADLKTFKTKTDESENIDSDISE